MTGNYFTFAADALAGLLDELGIERVHLIGNSLGGGTAVRFALRLPRARGPAGADGTGRAQPERVRAGPDRRRQAADGVRGAARSRAGRSSAAFLRTLVFDQRLVTDELVDERFAAASDPAALAAMASMGASFFDPAHAEEGLLWREAHRLRQRVLLIWGREDRVNPLDGALVALKTIRRAQLHVFGGCGHWAQLEKFDEFNRLVISFLEGDSSMTADPARWATCGSSQPTSPAWREFGVRVLGMVEGRGPDPDAVYLRMDDFPARLVILPGEQDRLLATGWEVADEGALAGVGAGAGSRPACAVKAGTSAECAERRVAQLLRARGPVRQRPGDLLRRRARQQAVREHAGSPVRHRGPGAGPRGAAGHR